MRALAALGALFALLVGHAGCLGGMVHAEQEADLRAPKPLVRERFQLQYPRNWSIDEADADYDPDHLFSIDSPGSCHVSVIVFDAVLEPKGSVEAQVAAVVPRIVRNPVETPFTRWGAHEGEGMTLAGRILGIFEGTIRIFAHASEPENLTFTIVEFCFAEDLPLVRPGFELIERTFELRRPLR